MRSEHSNISVLTFSNDKDSFQVNVNYNWHEGDNKSFKEIKPVILGTSTVYQLIEGKFNPDQYNNENETVLGEMRFKDDTHMTFKWSGSTDNYIKLSENINEFVNETVIAGKYVDQSGKIYDFNKNGTVDWNGEKREYKITVDFVEVFEKDALDMPCTHSYGQLFS